MSGHRIARLGWMLLITLALAAGGCKSFVQWLEGPGDTARAYRQAERLYDAQRFSQAAVAYRAWLADYHDTQDVLRPFILYKLGECYRLTRDYDRAVRVYTKLLELYAESTDEDVREVVKLTKARLDDIRPNVELRPEAPAPAEPEATPADSVGDFTNAELLFDAQTYAEAAAAYEAWLAAYTDVQDVLRPLVLYKLGESYRLGGDNEQAAEVYAKLIAAYASTEDADIRNVVALAEIRLGDINAALENPPEAEEPGARTENRE